MCTCKRGDSSQQSHFFRALHRPWPRRRTVRPHWKLAAFFCSSPVCCFHSSLQPPTLSLLPTLRTTAFHPQQRCWFAGPFAPLTSLRARQVSVCFAGRPSAGASHRRLEGEAAQGGPLHVGGRRSQPPEGGGRGKLVGLGVLFGGAKRRVALLRKFSLVWCGSGAARPGYVFFSFFGGGVCSVPLHAMRAMFDIHRNSTSSWGEQFRCQI